MEKSSNLQQGLWVFTHKETKEKYLVLLRGIEPFLRIIYAVNLFSGETITDYKHIIKIQFCYNDYNVNSFCDVQLPSVFEEIQTVNKNSKDKYLNTAKVMLHNRKLDKIDIIQELTDHICIDMYMHPLAAKLIAEYLINELTDKNLEK